MVVYDAVKKRLCPNLTPLNSTKTSEPTFDYNCLAWALGITDLWMDMPNYFQPFYNLDPSNLDHSAKGYAQILAENFGFEQCDNPEVEDDFEKVVLYEKDGDWTHIAIQLSNGAWSSKLGDLEDIVHTSVDALAGGPYGNPILYMKRQRK